MTEQDGIEHETTDEGLRKKAGVDGSCGKLPRFLDAIHRAITNLTGNETERAATALLEKRGDVVIVRESGEEVKGMIFKVQNGYVTVNYEVEHGGAKKLIQKAIPVEKFMSWQQ